MGIDLSRESVPDATTLLKFRRLLVTNDLTRALFEEINAHLAQQGLLMRAGTIVDATIIAAPSSTKNASGERDREMHQAKKGNQWHHGMKAHIGVDAQSDIVHSLVSTAANVNDVTQAGELPHGEETDAFGDAGYRGVDKREEAQRPQWHIAMQPGKRKRLSDSTLGQTLEKVEKIKASIRAKVEHPFHVIKSLFRHRKTPDRGLAKNHAQLFSLFGLAKSGDCQAAVVGGSWRKCVLNAANGRGRVESRAQNGHSAPERAGKWSLVNEFLGRGFR